MTDKLDSMKIDRLRDRFKAYMGGKWRPTRHFKVEVKRRYFKNDYGQNMSTECKWNGKRINKYTELCHKDEFKSDCLTVIINNRDEIKSYNDVMAVMIDVLENRGYCYDVNDDVKEWTSIVQWLLKRIKFIEDNKIKNSENMVQYTFKGANGRTRVLSTEKKMSLDLIRENFFTPKTYIICSDKPTAFPYERYYWDRFGNAVKEIYVRDENYKKSEPTFEDIAAKFNTTTTAEEVKEKDFDMSSITLNDNAETADMPF